MFLVVRDQFFSLPQAGYGIHLLASLAEEGNVVGSGASLK
jgi:hypothetical protein